MRSLSEKLLARKIVLHGRAAAGSSHKVLCPECSHTRRNKKDPCLSLTVDATATTPSGIATIAAGRALPSGMTSPSAALAAGRRYGRKIQSSDRQLR